MVPKTRAKTAYGLLSHIRRLILEEPLRYNQGDTLYIRGKTSGLRPNYEQVPDCGTVGCVAGWVTALQAKHPELVASVLTYADKVLGLDVTQHEELFTGNAAGRMQDQNVAQTRYHAEQGAALIARFQEKYGAQLRAKKLKAVR